MDRDAEKLCPVCHSRNWDRSGELHGERVCFDCGFIDDSFRFVSTPAPLFEGDDTRPGGPSRRQAPAVAPNTTLEDGDIVTLKGYCNGKGYKIGFGNCIGKIHPSS